MAIRIQHSPSPALMGQVAYAAGAGQEATRRGEANREFNLRTQQAKFQNDFAMQQAALREKARREQQQIQLQQQMFNQQRQRAEYGRSLQNDAFQQQYQRANYGRSLRNDAFQQQYQRANYDLGLSRLYQSTAAQTPGLLGLTENQVLGRGEGELSSYGQEQLDLQTLKTLQAEVDGRFSQYRSARMSDEGRRELATLNGKYMATKESYPTLNAKQRTQALAQIAKQFREANIEQYVQKPPTLDEQIETDTRIINGIVYQAPGSELKVTQLKTSGGSGGGVAAQAGRTNSEYYEEAALKIAEERGVDPSSIPIGDPEVVGLMERQKIAEQQRREYYDKLNSGEEIPAAANAEGESAMPQNGPEAAAEFAEQVRSSNARVTSDTGFENADGGIYYKGGDRTLRQTKSTMLEEALVNGHNNPKTKKFEPGIVQSPPGRLDLSDKKNEAAAKAFAQATLDFKSKNPDAEISDDTPHIDIQQAMKTASLNDKKAVRNALEKAKNSLFDDIGGMKSPYVFTGKKIEKTGTVIKKLKLIIDNLIKREEIERLRERGPTMLRP